MFPVVAAAFGRRAGTAALVGAQSVFVSRGTARVIGIHIPYFSVWLNIGSIIGIPQTGSIGKCSMWPDDYTQRSAQGVAGAHCCIVIAGRYLTKCYTCIAQQKG